MSPVIKASLCGLSVTAIFAGILIAMFPFQPYTITQTIEPHGTYEYYDTTIVNKNIKRKNRHRERVAETQALYLKAINDKDSVEIKIKGEIYRMMASASSYSLNPIINVSDTIIVTYIYNNLTDNIVYQHEVQYVPDVICLEKEIAKQKIEIFKRQDEKLKQIKNELLNCQ